MFKRKVKLFLYMFLSVFIIFITGCNENNDIKNLSQIEIYNKAIDNLLNVDSFKANISNELIISENEIESHNFNVVEFKQKNEQSNKVIEFTSKDYSQDNEEDSFNIKGYFKDGYLYVENPEGKFKNQLDYEDIINTLYASFSNINQESILNNDESVSKDEKGNYVLNLSINTENLQNTSNSYYNSFINYLGISESIQNQLIIKNAQLNAIVDENFNFLSYKAVFDAELTEENNSMPFNLVSEGSISDINSTNIDFPNDLSLYVDINSNLSE